MNGIATAMRSIYEEATDPNSEYTIDLEDMHTKKEQDNKTENYEPANYLKELIKFENLAEEIWLKREAFFANDIKVDQVPGFDSLYEEKAKYDKKKFTDELELRINRRVMSSDKIETMNIAKNIKGKAGNLLTLPGTGLKTETDKINHSLAIIEAITKALNGEC